MGVKNDGFVTRRRPMIICFSHVLLLILYGVLFSLLIIFLHQPIAQICLGIGWMESTKKLKLEHILEFQLYVGRDGITLITLFLTRMEHPIYCRLSIWPHIGSSYGPSCSCRINGNLWILDATDWWCLPMISSAGLAGSILVDFRMHRSIYFHNLSQQRSNGDLHLWYFRKLVTSDWNPNQGASPLLFFLIFKEG
jgi:hypothetical protein